MSLHLHEAPLLFAFGCWALKTVSRVLLLLQQWNILLYQSISQSDNTITCLVSALLNLTDEVVIGFCLTSYNDISPVKNKKSSHLAISDTVPLTLIFSSVQFSRSAISNTLRPHELQHTRPPCQSPPPRVYPNSCPLSWWCHPAILSSVVCFSACLQSFQASGSFQMSQLFTSGGQSIGVSASTTVLPVNTQD